MSIKQGLTINTTAIIHCPALSRAVVLTVLVVAAVARTGAAVTCYSCGPGHGAGAAVEAGSCAEPHHAEYCAGVDWCVKTWRGNTSAMSGEHVTRVYWDYWDTWTRLHGIMGLQIQGRGTWLVAGTRGTCELRRVVTPVSIQIELSQPVD